MGTWSVNLKNKRQVLCHEDGAFPSGIFGHTPPLIPIAHRHRGCFLERLSRHRGTYSLQIGLGSSPPPGSRGPPRRWSPAIGAPHSQHSPARKRPTHFSFLFSIKGGTSTLDFFLFCFFNARHLEILKRLNSLPRIFKDWWSWPYGNSRKGCLGALICNLDNYGLYKGLIHGCITWEHLQQMRGRQ